VAILPGSPRFETVSVCGELKLSMSSFDTHGMDLVVTQ